MRIKSLIVAVAGLLVLPFCAAQATTYTYDFTATGFGNQSGGTVFKDVSGTFTVDLDPTQDYSAQTSGLTVTFNSGSPSFDGTFAFSFDKSTDQLTIGSLADGAVGTASGSFNDFYFIVSNFPNNASLQTFVYSQAGKGTVSTFAGSVAATPVPPALPLMGTAILALVGFGYVASRRKGLAASAAAMPA
jgi:hypothetical protein